MSALRRLWMIADDCIVDVAVVAAATEHAASEIVRGVPRSLARVVPAELPGLVVVEIPEPAPAPSLADRIAALEAEIAALKGA